MKYMWKLRKVYNMLNLWCKWFMNNEYQKCQLSGFEIT